MHKSLILYLMTFFLALIGTTAHALKFEPMVIDLTPTGTGSREVVRVINDSNSIMAVQVSVVTRIPDLTGKEQREDAEDDFLVYPPQIILRAGQTQVVRVQWLGTPVVQTEQAYRIIAEELPVKFSSTPGASVKLLLRYVDTVYIVPKKPKSNLVIEKVEEVYLKRPPKTKKTKANTRQEAKVKKVHSNKKKRYLAITIRNVGNAHTFPSKLSLQVRSSASSRVVTLSGKQVKDEISDENILAGYARRFFLPWPKGLAMGQLSAILTYTEKR